MVLVADDNTDRLGSERDSLVAALEAVGAKLLGEETGNQRHNSRGEGVEHFGYVDGRSQPLFLTEDVDHEKLIGGGGTNLWDPAFAPDQVLVTNAGSLLGSFFVFRKLEQNVEKFKQTEQAIAGGLGFHDEFRELAGAMMVGRFEDGTPVVLRDRAGIGGAVLNNFNYDDDKTAVKCPFHGHIRKTNPRGAGGFEPVALERRHIMARRGITYGEREDDRSDLPSKNVGLLFQAYQVSIENQFEFTQATWANNPGFPNPGGQPQPGIDPVIAQGPNPPNTQHTPKQWGDPATPKPAQDFHGFVTMKGGEYFFAPTIATLHTL